MPEAGRWDDLALWTGSVARGDDGVWRLFYSGLSSSRGLGVRDQRIGMAESDDLFGWRRVGDRALIAPDLQWYRSDAWRDPFVFKDPAGHGSSRRCRRRDRLALANSRSRKCGSSTAGHCSCSRAIPTSRAPRRLVQRRDGSWALLGFRNLGRDAPGQLEIVDPIPAAVRDGELIDLR